MYPALPIDNVTAMQAAMMLLALLTACINFFVYNRA